MHRVPTLCDDNFTCTENTEQCWRDAEQPFIAELETIESCIHVQHGGTDTRVEYRCSQTLRSRSIIENGSRKWLKNLPEVFHYNGALIFLYKDSRLTIRLKHDVHHPTANGTKNFTTSEREYIIMLSQTGIAPYQTLSMMRSRFKGVFLYEDVYNTWSDSMSGSFKKHSDPFHFVNLYVSSCSEVIPIYHQEKPFALAFVTTLGKSIYKNWNFVKVFIESTFKTNCQKLELFAVMITCMCFGFSCSCMLLGWGTNGVMRRRENSLSFFLSALRKAPPRINPTFFFTDTDVA